MPLQLSFAPSCRRLSTQLWCHTAPPSALSSRHEPTSIRLQFACNLCEHNPFDSLALQLLCGPAGSGFMQPRLLTLASPCMQAISNLRAMLSDAADDQGILPPAGSPAGGVNLVRTSDTDFCNMFDLQNK